MQRVIPWVCVFYLVGVLFFYTIVHDEFNSQEFNQYYDQKKLWIGNVVNDPDRGLEQTKIVVLPDGFTEKILVTLPKDTRVDYGDSISFTAAIKKPESFVTDTERVFNYPAYLAVKNIYATARVFEIDIIDRGQGFFVVARLYKTKRYIVAKIVELFPQNEAGLLAGIVIGEQSLVPKDIYKDFQIAGLTHMMVLSGYNITLVTTAVIGLLARLGFGYRWRRMGALIIIPLFIIMTGLNASSVRAGCMTVMVLLLQITTRIQESWRVVLFALTGMVMINPVALVYDPGLHLSFLAFIGLMYCSPITKKWFARLPSFFRLRDVFSETLGVQLFVLPYILYMSGMVSLLILFSNIATTPFVPVVMMGSLVVIGLESTMNGFAGPIVIIVKLLLTYIVTSARFVAHNEWAIVTVPAIAPIIVLGIYGLFTCIIYMVHRKRG
jgi:competence protein ComEC